MNDWLTESMRALAAEAGVDPATISMPDADANDLLDIARIASHTSGERINAPLLCYLIGRIIEQSPDTSILALKEIVTRRAQSSAG